jgi:hypothetical protein
MKHFKRYHICFALCLLVALLLPCTILAQEVQFPEPDTYIPSVTKLQDYKRYFDDPRPFLNKWNYRSICPAVIVEMLTYDIDKMKTAWADIVGFKAPNVVGKIHPEIKPGKYTYKDVQNNPAFKELMFPTLYNRIKPGGPPLGGNIPEFEIIPTQQYYYSLPVCEATRKNEGKTKLNEKGYVVWQTWVAGYPFPRPSGPQKAYQILYNWIYRCDKFEKNGVLLGESRGFDKQLRQDGQNIGRYIAAGLAGRTILPPYGYYDENAKARGESWAMFGQTFYPREAAGTSIMNIYYQDPEKSDTSFIYLPGMRRVRKLSTTDTQDPLPFPGATDTIPDDQNVFTQKFSPKVYPYRVELIGEQEYLVPSLTTDGSDYLTSKGLEFRGIKMERRPMYVLQLTQLSPDYVYSKRILYIDKETFLIPQAAYFDRKGRLYRTVETRQNFIPQAGQFSWNGYSAWWDHIDSHSSIGLWFEIPARLTRQDLMNKLTSGSVK